MIFGFMDPYLLVCPNDLSDEGRIFNYIHNLIAWSELKNERWINIVVPRTASEILASTNGFPPWQALSTVLRRQDIGIQASDVFEVMNALLTRGPMLEELVKTNEILVDAVSCSHDYYIGRGSKHEEEFERLLGMISLSQIQTSIAPERRQLLTTAAPCPHRLKFSMSIVAIEYSDPVQSEPKVPLQISDDVLGVCCPRVATMLADSLAVWESAKDEEGFRAAIDLHASQQAMSQGIGLPSWRMGKHFVPSIERMHLLSRVSGAKVLRACSETILGNNLAAVHAIRTSAGAGSPQLKRGEDLAVRRDVDYELHLHYWNTANGPELSRIAPHNDLWIPE